MKHVVAGKAENIVNVVVFAPFHRLRRHARQGSQERSSDNSVAFAPVIVEAAPPGAAIPIAPRLTIEIVVDAATFRIPPGIDAATLQMVLRAVRAAT